MTDHGVTRRKALGAGLFLASRYPDVCERLEKMMTECERAIEKNPGGWIGNGHGG
jgi:hypothetical protein